MKKRLEYFAIILLFAISFIYTNKISNIVKNKDPIMIKINEISNNVRISSVNAVVNDDEITPGKSGCDIDINGSYQNMKQINEYTDKMLKYKDLVPEISINNTYNKYIVSGNSLDRNVSIIVYIKDSLEKVNKINNTKLNIFLDGNLLKNGKVEITENKKIYNAGMDHNYDDTTIEWINDVIESSYNKSLYCLNIDKDDNNLLQCSKNKMHTINPKVVYKSVLNIKENIKNGSIIYFDENNIDKLDLVINYILKKGYNIVYLDELLNEKTCNNN